jgi:membrane fusion protein, multidrug efflux system
METESTPVKNTGKAKKIRAYIALFLVILALAIGAWVWYRNFTAYLTTDDAYIDADKVSVSAKIMGRITSLYAGEGDSVKTGKLLVVLDSTDMVAQKLQAMAARDQAATAIGQAQARLTLDEATGNVQEINLEKAKEDLDRATAQLNGNVIAKEQYDHIKKAYESAKAQVEASRAQLAVSRAQIGNAESSLKTASAQVATIQTNLANTRIYAPGSGRIAKKWLMPGDVVQPGQAILTVTKDSLLWVICMYEETKVSDIFIGQKSEFTVDAFPGMRFYGKVFYIGTNTAAQFSLIPPNNASGNFTKVTQRIPVKISIDSIADPEKRYPHFRLAAGMSVMVKIHKK